MTLVTVYDPDGLNPYGREVAATLSRGGHSVRLLAPADVAWLPDDIEVLRVLPATGPAGRATKLRQLLTGLRHVLVDALRGRTVIVCWSWYAIEKLAVAVAGLVTNRVIVVAHNPGGRGPRLRHTVWAEALELKSARRVVVHAGTLAGQLPAHKTWICVHPPYSSYLRAHDAEPRRESSDVVTLLVLGAVRPDKGLNLLEQIISELSADVRDRLRVHLIGRDRDAGREIAPSLERWVDVINELRPRGVSDGELVTALRGAQALMAFYPGATQSGSVILALTAGVPVLAFGAGALGDVVRPEFLVPNRDTIAAASLVESFLSGALPLDASRVAIEAWEDRAVREWGALVELCSGRAR